MHSGHWIESAAKPDVQLALVSVLLGSISVLLVISAIFAYIRVAKRAEKVAKLEAVRIAKEIAEFETCKYLQTEMPLLMKEHIELGENANLLENAGDTIAQNFDEE